MQSAKLRPLPRQSFAAGVEISDCARGLAALHRPDCAAALWNRPARAGFQNWITALPPQALPQTRQILRPDQFGPALKQSCMQAGTPASPHRDWLIADICALGTLFADLMDVALLRLRLDVVTTNACRKFHIDALRARLICTYRGTGTQYGTALPGGHDPQRILTAPTQTPLVLRGTNWPETPQSGLQHRSPPIAGSGETRLLLVLDPIVDPTTVF
ncbi:MAG: DUF1826 domain-containing protein [Pelagimonas sp.]|jgi:hypothetical protein|nr:DUF1826 domain-containing protein [Pelagimonas sp.]